jgi:hypothetical protein
MASVVVLTDPILEGSTKTYSVQLVDETGADLPSDVLLSLTLTYYDKDTLTVINARQDQDVLDGNDVTVSVDGLIEWNMQVEDTALVDSRKGLEAHIILLTWSWQSGIETKIDRHEAQVTIEAVPLG